MVFDGVGTFTTIPYVFRNQIIADATATAALVAYTGRPFITELQYRNPAFAVYDIVAYDYNTINPGFVTLTLDRPMDGAWKRTRSAILHLPALLRCSGERLAQVGIAVRTSPTDIKLFNFQN